MYDRTIWPAHGIPFMAQATGRGGSGGRNRTVDLQSRMLGNRLRQGLARSLPIVNPGDQFSGNCVAHHSPVLFSSTIWFGRALVQLMLGALNAETALRWSMFSNLSGHQDWRTKQKPPLSKRMTPMLPTGADARLFVLGNAVIPQQGRTALQILVHMEW